MSKPFNVNTNRFDPYKNFRFVVSFIDQTTTQPVAGVSKVSGLKRSSDVIEYKEGGNGVTFKGIGRTKYEAITLERGVTHDSAFEDWANAAQVLDRGHASSSLRKLRKQLRIDLKNEAGQTAMSFVVHRCWVSEYQALPDLDAGGNAIALEHVKVEHDGWERDLNQGEPDESKGNPVG